MWNPFNLLKKKAKKEIKTRPPFGSRELNELLAAEIEEKRLERSASMNAYQKSLRGG